MPKISVIIPVFNTERYIGQCLQSILSQSLADIEIICIDDGSMDDSFEIITQLQMKDQRIIVVRQQNCGAGMTRNRGIQIAKGEYVMFVDSDDYLLDKKLLENMYLACIRHNVQICGALRKYDSDGKLTDSDLHRLLMADSTDGKMILYTDYQYDFHFQSYIYDRQMLLNYDINFPAYKRFEDPVFFVKAMTAAQRFYVIPAEGYCYRMGHQTDSFSPLAVTDIVRGITDNLYFSAAYGFKRLHKLTVNRIEEGYYYVIIRHLQKGNFSLFEALWKANAAVKWEWLEERKETLLKPLQFALDAAHILWEKYERYIKSSCCGQAGNMWLFPFSKVPAPGKVILYAAGSVGRAYARQLEAAKGYEFVLWVDRNAEKLAEHSILPVEQILETEYDYIVIAVEDKKTADRIKQNLLDMGIDRNKIIWQMNIEAEDINRLCIE